jgi:hypothetical protein
MWNEHSFFYIFLTDVAQLSVGFLQAIRSALVIADATSFLEFFCLLPQFFLPKSPPGLLHDHCDELYTASMVGTFIGVYVYHNTVISSYAPALDQPYYPGDHDQQQVLYGHFARYFSQNSMERIPPFTAAYNEAVACAHNSAPLRLPFSAFNSRLGAPIPTTPPAPLSSASYQYSPIFYPMSAANPFSNVPAVVTNGRSPVPTPTHAAVPTPVGDPSDSSSSSSSRSSSSSSDHGGGGG